MQVAGDLSLRCQLGAGQRAGGQQSFHCPALLRLQRLWECDSAVSDANMNLAATYCYDAYGVPSSSENFANGWSPTGRMACATTRRRPVLDEHANVRLDAR